MIQNHLSPQKVVLPFYTMETLYKSISRVTRFFSSPSHNCAIGRAVLFAIAFAILLVVLLRFAHYHENPDFTRYDAGPERKEAFFSYFLPLIEEQNRELLEVREELVALQEQREQLSFFERLMVENLAQDYAVEDFAFDQAADWETLIRRIDIVPPSLALAQAANESAWGTSRFAREGNNFYGQWCFRAGCGMVPASRDAGATHEVADFASPEESVQGYFLNINQHPAYQGFRETRASLRDEKDIITGLDLVGELQRYSERGQEYVQELSSMIRFNELTEFDQAIVQGV